MNLGSAFGPLGGNIRYTSRYQPTGRFIHLPTSSRSTHASLAFETQVLLRRHDAQGVGVAHAAPPALHAHDNLALLQDAELDGLRDTPLEAAVDVFLPDGHVEVGLALGEEERVNATVEVGVLGKRLAD